MNTESLNLLCMNCFSQLHASGAACPACGYHPASQAESLYHLPPRTILGGKYMVGSVLGEGGFGITYIGYDLNLDIKVAIKEYYPSGLVMRSTTMSMTVQPLGGEQGEYFVKGRERFVDEAKRLARFRTLPGIVMVNDFFVENGTAYIVMEYVEGTTLKNCLAQLGGKIPAAQLLDMMGPLFGSLSKVHEGGIIHRDISPDNIMIARDGTVKLLDFGAAREFGDGDNKSLSVMLKHGYAPAEQYSSRGVQGPHTDVYALSATIYKAITGITPEDSMDRVFEDRLAAPGQLGAALPAYQEAALMKGLAVRAENRFRTVGELGEALGVYAARTTEQRMQNMGIQGAQPNSQLIAHNAQMQGMGSAAPQATVYAPVPDAAAPPSSQFYSHSAPMPGHSTPHSQLNTPPTPRRAEKKPAAAAPGKKKIIAIIAAVCVVAAVIYTLTLQGSPGGDDANTRVGGMSGDNAAAPSDRARGEDAGAQPGGESGGASGEGVAAATETAPSYNVVAIGLNDQGQCDVSDWHDIIAVTAGYDHTIGLKSDGTVIMAGQDQIGQRSISGWRDIIAVSTGFFQTIGLKSDGTVTATGGYMTFGPESTSSWRDIAAVSAGGMHTVGLRADGTVVASGYNEHGQCDVSDWRDIVQVSAGFEYTVGLTSGGTVLATGQNDEGQCDVYVWRDIIAVSAGGTHTVGLKSDGTVVAVGNNDNGQCEVSGWQGIVKVFTGYAQTFGLKTDGTLVSTGGNDYYQLDVSGLRGVVDLAAGLMHVVAVVSADAAAPGGSGDLGAAPSGGGAAGQMNEYGLIEYSYADLDIHFDWNAEFAANIGAIGGVMLSFRLVGDTTEVSNVLIAAWSARNGWTPQSIAENAEFATGMWKNEGSLGHSGHFDRRVSNGFPIWDKDLGESFDVLLIVLNSDYDALGYVLVPVTVPSSP